jgi:hypothetical protein
MTPRLNIHDLQKPNGRALIVDVTVRFWQHDHAKGKFTNRVEATALSEDAEKTG